MVVMRNCGTADPLDEAEQEQRLDAFDPGGGEHRQAEERKAAKENGPAPEGIRETPEEYLGEAEAQEEDADHELRIVGVGNVERLADAWQSRQHAVDRERNARGHDRNGDDEFDKAHSEARGARGLIGVAR